MLSPDVRVEGFTAEQWHRLAEVARAPGGPAPSARPRGGVVALTTEGRLGTLFSTLKGHIDLAQQPWPIGLEELAARHGARWAMELGAGSLDALADRVADRLRPADTFLSQTLELFAALRELEAEGKLHVFPWPVAQWPIPTERAVVRALDALCPVGRVALLGVFARGELYTAIAVRRGVRGIDAIIGPSDLAQEMGLVSGDWERDYRFLAAATERSVGPLALGCFGELFTFQSLSRSETNGAWASAVAARDIVLSPATPGVAVPLGLDAGRALWSSVRGIAERFGASEWLPAAGRLAPSIERGFSVFEADIRAWLGFDPLKLLVRLLAPRG
jgi:hypothetical protein